MDFKKLDLFWIGLEQNLGEKSQKQQFCLLVMVIIVIAADTKTGNPGKLETRDGSATVFFSRSMGTFGTWARKMDQS